MNFMLQLIQGHRELLDLSSNVLIPLVVRWSRWHARQSALRSLLSALLNLLGSSISARLLLLLQGLDLRLDGTYLRLPLRRVLQRLPKMENKSMWNDYKLQCM
jgi:hypothetical protein